MNTIKHSMIYPNPNQPRKYFHPGKLEELANSIKSCDLLEPIVVTKRDNRYMIIAGERRWRACSIVGLIDIPVRIIAADEQTILELSLLENLQREDLNIIEEAMAFQELINSGLTVKEIADKMGMKCTFRIEWRLSLLNLDPIYQECTIKGILTPTQAREMSRLPKDKQRILFDKISSGKANTQTKLTSIVNAMLHVQEKLDFIQEPTPEEKEIKNKYDCMIEKIINFINKSFNRDDLSILATVLSPASQQKIDHIDMIILHLNKIKKALIKATSVKDALQESESIS